MTIESTPETRTPAETTATQIKAIRDESPGWWWEKKQEIINVCISAEAFTRKAQGLASPEIVAALQYAATKQRGDYLLAHQGTAQLDNIINVMNQVSSLVASTDDLDQLTVLLRK